MTTIATKFTLNTNCLIAVEDNRRWTLSVAPIVGPPRAPCPGKAFLQQLLAYLLTIGSIDVDERPVRWRLVCHAAEDDPQALFSQKFF